MVNVVVNEGCHHSTDRYGLMGGRSALLILCTCSEALQGSSLWKACVAGECSSGDLIDNMTYSRFQYFETYLGISATYSYPFP